MAKIAQNITELIGHTPLLELKKYDEEHKLAGRILVKLESFNPLSSVKDRVALAMVEDAEKSGKLKPGATIIEPTSGNTGIGLAFVGAAKGYKVVLTMPDTMSIERRNLLKALGAKLVLTPGAEGMKGAINKALELVESTPGAYIPQQFENPSNPEIHRQTTGKEIWDDTDGKVDFFIAGVGTGGTVTGVGETLKEHNPNVKIIAVEPFDSQVLAGGKPGPHKIQGIGAGFVPAVLNTKVLDQIAPVKTEEAFQTARELARHEGVLVGISSAAAVFVATQLAKKEENRGKTIVALLPDTGERYLSTPLFDIDSL